MAASTITRDTWTNDTGTASVPNLDGTVINNAALQNNIYARVDEMFSGAGSYTTLTLGGKLSVEGGQITFPSSQSSSAGANTLDDYEEGSWTPTITGSGGSSGQTYTTQTGRYNKIGNQVTCWFTLTLSAKGTITGSVQIGGIPFTCNSTVYGVMSLGYFENFSTSFVHVAGWLAPSTSAVTIWALTAAAVSTSAIAQADMANNTLMVGVISYRSDT